MINYILILCDGITRERCSVVCKLFDNTLDSFKNINKEYIKNRDPVLYKEVRLLKFDDDELYEVCRIGDIELLKYYSIKDLDFNFGLRGACFGGHLGIVKFMVKKGASKFICGLYEACQCKHTEIAVFIIKKGKINVDYGLYIAYKYKHMKIVELMIEKGAQDIVYL